MIQTICNANPSNCIKFSLFSLGFFVFLFGREQTSSHLDQVPELHRRAVHGLKGFERSFEEKNEETLRSPNVGTSSARHVFFGWAQGSAETLQFPGSEWLQNILRCSSAVKFQAHLIEASARFHLYKLNCGTTKPLCTWQQSAS